MRARGITYDTGFLPDAASRPHFDPADVRHEMAVIAEELHCDAVRVSGGDPARLTTAARCAAAAGLEVWFAPFPVDLHADELPGYFEECARRAEEIARGGARVVLVAGCEISAFCAGFLPGDSYRDRLHAMATADLDWWLSLGPVDQRLNASLATAAAAVRRHFSGRVTYASGPWEPVDWSPFDIVGVDAYRAAHNAHAFREEIRAHTAHGKPVAVTEYGTCPYRGAGDLGGMAWQVPEGAEPDEGEQVRYFEELLTVFEEEGVDTALWFTYAGFNRTGTAALGSYGVLGDPDGPRSRHRRAVFHTMATRYANAGSGPRPPAPAPRGTYHS